MERPVYDLEELRRSDLDLDPVEVRRVEGLDVNRVGPTSITLVRSGHFKSNELE